MTDTNSVPSTWNGRGCGFVTKPSLMPRTGSRRVRTHAAIAMPGSPTAMNATCQPRRPNGGSTGYISAHQSRIVPPRKRPAPIPIATPLV